MKIKIEVDGKTFSASLSEWIDISIPIKRQNNPNAFYLHNPEFKTVEAGNFVGNVARGGSCNCEDITFNPHGNGTHTECAGHVSAEDIYISDCIKDFFFLAELITVQSLPDTMISRQQIEEKFPEMNHQVKAVIIRTFPNSESKKHAVYSGNSPAYFSEEAIVYLNDCCVEHILTDLPSLDKEDDTELSAHKVFFSYPQQWNTNKTITEMVYVPDAVVDGTYLLNLQVSAFESDAAPSRPLLYALQQNNISQHNLV